MSNITVIGIDLAKSVFQICGLNQANKRQFNISVKRTKLVETVLQHPNATIAMEACGSAHHWGRVFSELGYHVKLVPAQHVKGFSRGNKNDALDALAIAEASQRPKVHFVAIKTIEQQDYQTLLRARTRLIEDRTATINQARGTLAEYGVVLPRSVAAFKRGIPEIMDNPDNGLTPIIRTFIQSLYADYQTLTRRINELGQQLAAIATTHPVTKSLLRLRGVGPISAVAIYAGVGNGSQFKNARQLAAWVGLVPRQHGSGGVTRLGSISKRGNRYLRLLLIHGARAVMHWLGDKSDQLSLWARQLIERRGRHKAVVAMANKTARMIWVVVRRGIEHVPDHHLSVAG